MGNVDLRDTKVATWLGVLLVFTSKEQPGQPVDQRSALLPGGTAALGLSEIALFPLGGTAECLRDTRNQT